MQKKTIALALMLLACAASAIADPLKSSYRVLASGCVDENESRAITGFVLHGSRDIHTALHGVLGCENISAVRANDDGTVISDLKVAHVDIRRDIAVLSSSKTIPKGTLKASTSSPDPLRIHEVVGFPQGMSGAHRISVSFQSPPLISLRKRVPPSIIRILDSRGSPSLDTQVLDVLGDLQSGHSGAALLDSNGQVVGIVNGGIGRGEFGIGWAIPIQDVTLSTYRSSKGEIDELIEANHSNLFSSTVKESRSQRRNLSDDYRKAIFSIGIFEAISSFTYSCPGVDVDVHPLMGGLVDFMIEKSNHALSAIEEDLPERIYNKISDVIDSKYSSRQGLNDLLDLFNSTTERELLKASSSAGRQVYLLGMIYRMMESTEPVPYDAVDDWNKLLGCLRRDLRVNAAILAGQAGRLRWPQISAQDIGSADSKDRVQQSIENLIVLLEPRMLGW